MSKLFFGKDGEKVFSRKSYLYDNERVYFDSHGKRIGTSRPSLFMPGQTNYYDTSGKKVGHSHKSYLYDNQTNYYNNSHEKQGTSRKSYLYDDVNVYHDRNHNYKGFDVKPIIDPYPDNDEKENVPKQKETVRVAAVTRKKPEPAVRNQKKSGDSGYGFIWAIIIPLLILICAMFNLLFE